MSRLDAVGLLGVELILVACAAAQAGRLDPVRPPALLTDLLGACLVMVSMIRAFNLAAFVMDASWAVVALYGPARCALMRGRSGR